jgi:membrane peptidoglycan carboxypeptidase
MKDYKRLIQQLRHHIPGAEEHLGKRIFFWILAVGIGFFLLGTVTFGGLVAILSIGLPDVSDLENLSGAQSTEIFDRDENLLYTIHGEENREYIPMEDINTHVINATVSIEDDEFWKHSGFDILALGRAVLAELGIGGPRGGSTITQQYVKNAFLSSEHSYVRKLKELILSLRVEREYDKSTILELYLNRIPYGNNAYGIQKAAEIYFNKDAKDLTLAESAILAALPQAPSRYNPYGANKYSHLLTEFSEEELFLRKIDEESDLEIEEYIRGCLGQTIELPDGGSLYIKGRSDLVLDRMAILNYITEDQKTAALAEMQEIEFSEFRETITHPHFVLYVKELLEDKYGKDVVEQGGLKVYTTINPDLQEYAEEVAYTKGTYNESAYGANNAAVLVSDIKTGEILAMVGSRDYYNEDIDGNVNVVTRPRQPGSSFKPIVYAQAFYNSYSPASVIYDVPTKFGSDEPQNYDGEFEGQMSMRKALGHSRNIPAIKAYFLAGRQEKIIDLSEKIGITSLNQDHSYGYPLALGAGEVSLMEMVTAYSTFGNEGRKPELTTIVRIENANGDIIETNEEQLTTEFKEVLDPQVAFLISDILSDESMKIGGNLSVAGHTVAAKTGTSTKENKKDAGGASVAPGDGWVIGYSPSIAVGVWIGNTDGAPMKLNANGHDSAGPIFKSVMTRALRNKSVETFREPPEIQHISVSTASGLLPGPNTPPKFVKKEVFASWAIPTEIDQSFYKVKIDSVSGLLATEHTPKEAVDDVLYINHKPVAPYENWAIAIINWFKEDTSEKVPQEYWDPNIKIAFGMPPTEKDNIHTSSTAKHKPEVTILEPVANSKITPGNIRVLIAYEAENGIDHVEYYINDDLEYSTKESPYTGHIRLSNYLPNKSRNLLSVKVIDKMGYSAESVVEFKVEK